MVMPRYERTVMPIKKLPGIAMPTKVAFRKPRLATTTIITITTAAMTLFVKSPSNVRTVFESSNR